jgi:hypothetical protein
MILRRFDDLKWLKRVNQQFIWNLDANSKLIKLFFRNLGSSSLQKISQNMHILKFQTSTCASTQILLIPFILRTPCNRLILIYKRFLARKLLEMQILINDLKQKKNLEEYLKFLCCTLFDSFTTSSNKKC